MIKLLAIISNVLFNNNKWKGGGLWPITIAVLCKRTNYQRMAKEKGGC